MGKEKEVSQDVLLKFECAAETSPGDLVKMQILDEQVGWGLRFCISNQFPGDAAAAGPGFEKQDLMTHV